MHIIFNGNGYSEEWRKEAERRGLPNLRTAPEAINAMGSEKNLALFERLGIMSKREVLSAQHILYENFSKTVAIEAECLYNMAYSFVIPVALEYKQRIAISIDMNSPEQASLLKGINENINRLLSSLNELKEKKDHAKKFGEEELKEQATHYRNEVRAAMDKVRVACDSLEVVVDDKMWPFPKYSELLFMK